MKQELNGDSCKILVIGINQPPTGYKNGKDTGTIRRLNEWMNDLGINHFSFSNIHEDKHHLSLKKVDYLRLEKMTAGYTKVITLGNYPSQALKKIGIKHFQLPHPSGLNRQLNDKVFVDNVLGECKKYIQNKVNAV